MIIIDNGRVIFTEPRYVQTCMACGAMGHGNATCRWCVATWPRTPLTIELLKTLTGRLPDPPLGARMN